MVSAKDAVMALIFMSPSLSLVHVCAGHGYCQVPYPEAPFVCVSAATQTPLRPSEAIFCRVLCTL